MAISTVPLTSGAHAEMDDLRIYSRALTEAEIQELFREALRLVATPTLTEWGTIALIMLLGIAAVYHLQE